MKGAQKLTLAAFVIALSLLLAYHFADAASTSYINITGGASMATIGGNVSIGTVSPIAKLSVGLSMWYNTSWQYREKIILNGSLIIGNLTDFPVLIKINDTNLTAYAQASGNDILFTDENGMTKLDHEIEKYNSATGELVAWVRVPRLYSQTNKTIYMYYGSSAAVSQQGTAGVWDSSFRGVWHMSLNSVYANDSTRNGNNGTSFLNVIDAQGAIGQGIFMNVGSINAASDSSLADIETQGGGGMTISAWIKPDTNNLQFMYIATKDQGATSGGTANGAWTFTFGGNPRYLGFRRSYLTQVLQRTSATNNVSYNNWQYVAMTWNGSSSNASVKFYVNGTETAYLASDDKDGIGDKNSDASQDFYIGSQLYATSWFNGSMDELRISNSVRSQAWLKTEFYNENNSDSFALFQGQDIPTSGNILVQNSTNNLFFINGISGNIGIGTTAPQATLHINGSGSSSSGLLLSNGSAAFFWVNSTSAKVMIGDGTSYAETPGNYRLQVYGNVNASSYATNGTDYAEWVVKLDANENMEEGDVVAIVNGRATKNFNLMTKADSFMVVTARAGFIGGPSGDGNVAVSFVGRVPVKILGFAKSGDYLIAYRDGLAIAKAKKDVTWSEFKRVIGTAWESGFRKVMVANGVR